VTALLVALGAAVGAPLRYVAGHLFDVRFPWGTVLVNVLGSFLLGLFTALGVNGDGTALLGVGFCGGFTTYSAFAVQSFDHGRRRGLANVMLTIPVALGACALGFALG